MVTQRNAQATSVAPTPDAAWSAASELPRQQMSLATEGACAVFRGFEAMRKIQEQAAHEALQHYADAAERLKRTSEPGQLMEIQADLLRFDFEGATQYWQQLGAAAMGMQRELMACCAHLVDEDALRQITSTMDSFAGVARGFDAQPTGPSSRGRRP